MQTALQFACFAKNTNLRAAKLLYKIESVLQRSKLSPTSFDLQFCRQNLVIGLALSIKNNNEYSKRVLERKLIAFWRWQGRQDSKNYALAELDYLRCPLSNCSMPS